MISHLGEMSPGDFCKTIEKRVRRDVRIKYPFSKGDKILVIDDGTAKGFAAQELLKSVLQSMPVEITVKDHFEEGYDKVILPYSGDDILQDFLGELFEKKKSSIGAGVPFLAGLLQSEVDAYAKIKGFSGKFKEKNATLEDLEKRFPGGKFALMKSRELLKN